jgi:signal transduction histidine kinase
VDEERPERAFEELEALYEIASMGGSQGDLAHVARSLTAVVARQVPSERSVLFLFDEDPQEMFVLSGEDGDRGTRYRLNECGLVRRVFLSRSGEVVNDVAADDDPTPLLAIDFDAKQVVAAPLRDGEDDVGVLVAINSINGAFSEEDLRMLMLLADRAAVTIKSTELVASLQRQVQEFDGLQRLSKLIVETDVLEDVIGESIKIVLGLVECEGLFIMLHDDATDSLVARKPAVGVSTEVLERLSVPLSEPSLAATVFRTSTPLLSNEARNDAWVGPHLRELLDIDNMLLAPISSGHRPFGILAAVNASSGQFEDEDLRFLSILGERVGSVIESTMSRERERDLMKQLREADSMKSEFVSMLAHELKGPMTTVMGFSHTLQEQGNDLPDNQRAHILGIINREVSRLSRLVNDLLDVSRMEAGTLRYELEPIDVREIVDSILQVHTSLRAGHSIEVEIPADLPKVVGDRDRVRQILINLLTNATRYSQDGTTVTVSGRAEDGKVVFGVADEGVGIGPEDQERVFSKFAQIPRPGWTKKGTGLGLYITKGIVEAHGGRIWIDSTPGKGATFCFSLNRAD